ALTFFAMRGSVALVARRPIPDCQGTCLNGRKVFANDTRAGHLARSNSLSRCLDDPMLGNMDSPLTALMFGTALFAVMLPARFVIQHRRGTLDWGHERPLLLGSPLIVLSMVAVTAAGPTARSVVPPFVISGLGVALLHYANEVPLRSTSSALCFGSS